MRDKTIFRTRFEPPLLKGKVVQYDEKKMTGIVRTVHGEDLFFNNASFLPKVNDLVVCNKYPSIKIPNRYYAKNISKGYMSMDGSIVIDDCRSHVHDDVRKHLPKVIKQISCDGRAYFYEKIQLPNIIGMSACVPITWEDEIVYAKRVGREKYSKFVKNKNLVPTQYVSIFLMKKQEVYIIRSCYYGEFVADTDFYDFDDDRQSFWNDHALVFGSEPIDKSTLTNTCPWTGVNENNRFGALVSKNVKGQNHN
jgi:hypothetical protein